MRIKRKGQSAMEYMTLVAIILGALIGGGFYFKRGVQGRWKASIDDMGEQYDPRLTNTDITYRISSATETIITSVPSPRSSGNGYWTMRDDYTNALETKTGTSRIGSF